MVEAKIGKIVEGHWGRGQGAGSREQGAGRRYKFKDTSG